MAEKITHEKIEPIMHEKIEPALKNLDERLARIEKTVKSGVGEVETFAREKPVMALGIALFGGFLLGVLLSKSRD